MKKLFNFSIIAFLLVLATSCARSYFVVDGDAVYRVDGAKNMKELVVTLRMKHYWQKVQDSTMIDSLVISSH